MPTANTEKCICPKNLGYEKFDDICKTELTNPVTCERLFNESDFCYMISTNPDHAEDFLTIHELLNNKLKDEVGVYALWEEVMECPSCNVHLMECQYVGKGEAIKRIKDHIKNRLESNVVIHVTFNRCHNRIAKYIEQLLLDSYNFTLNKEENAGEGKLLALWPYDRVIVGTEEYDVPGMLTEKYPNAWWKE